MRVNENIEKVRAAKGITKTFIANKLGMSLQGYRHLAKGDVRLDVNRLQVIAKALEVESAIFFDDKLTQSVIEELDC